MTLIRVPPHSDFEQGSGHHHEELEEPYIVTRGILTMRFDDEIEEGDATKVKDFWEASTAASQQASRSS